MRDEQDLHTYERYRANFPSVQTGGSCIGVLKRLRLMTIQLAP